LEEHPRASQREIAGYLGVSVGKVNYCLRALAQKGLLTFRNFRRNKNKQAYAYALTPKGLEAKLNVTYRFLKRKIQEYEEISSEIERLRREIGEQTRV